MASLFFHVLRVHFRVESRYPNSAFWCMDAEAEIIAWGLVLP